MVINFDSKNYYPKGIKFDDSDCRINFVINKHGFKIKIENDLNYRFDEFKDAGAPSFRYNIDDFGTVTFHAFTHSGEYVFHPVNFPAELLNFCQPNIKKVCKTNIPSKCHFHSNSISTTAMEG